MSSSTAVIDAPDYISLRDAAGEVGRRFHKHWVDSDPDALSADRDENPEAWDRAEAVEELLLAYIINGHVRAYQDAPLDGTGRAVIDIPPNWYEAGSFMICIRTSRFFVFTDNWEPIFINRASFLAHLPKVADERKAGRYHAKDVVHAAWKLALAQAEAPTKAGLTRQLLGWLGELDLYPDPSTLDDIVGEVVGFLAENKAGLRVCESHPPHERPPDPA